MREVSVHHFVMYYKIPREMTGVFRIKTTDYHFSQWAADIENRLLFGIAKNEGIQNCGAEIVTKRTAIYQRIE